MKDLYVHTINTPVFGSSSTRNIQQKYIYTNDYIYRIQQGLINKKQPIPKPQESKQSKKFSESKKAPKNKKQPIPKALKRTVWHKWIGEEKGKHKCLCCNISDITQFSFHCGHIIAESKGGELNIKNLKPICELCNKSMGSKNMNEFIKLLKNK